MQLIDPMNGHEFDFALAKQQMLTRQLRARGITSERVLSAMARVPREVFVEDELVPEAYADCALPIDCGQTISQPYIVALMTELLQLSGHERILEVGTGSGYQAAILGELGAEVFSIERHAPLSTLAGERLRRLGYDNVHLRVGDGSLGWPEAAPFDRVIVTAAAPRCPPALWEQLAEGGLLIGPFGSREEQTLLVIRKVHGELLTTRSIPCRFVPLIEGTD